jgi:hypothetical protein
MHSLLLMLGRRLIDGAHDAKVMLRMLEVAFTHDAVARACGVTPELQIFLKELLRRAANAEVGAIAVENVVTIERHASIAAAGALVAHSAAIAAATPATVGAISAMAATTHTFNVHYYDKSLSC